jgi:hypothetical protein
LNATGNVTLYTSNYTTSDIWMLDVCVDFCQTLFDSCANVTLTGKLTVRDIFSIAAPFCQATAPLNYTINLTNDSNCFDGRDLPASPYTSYLFGLPSTLVVGQEATFFVQATDVYGNNLTIGNSSLFTAFLFGPQNFAAKIYYTGSNGLYTGNFTSIVAGSYELHVQLRGTELVGSPAGIEFVPG